MSKKDYITKQDAIEFESTGRADDEIGFDLISLIKNSAFKDFGIDQEIPKKNLLSKESDIRHHLLLLMAGRFNRSKLYDVMDLFVDESRRFTNIAEKDLLKNKNDYYFNAVDGDDIAKNIQDFEREINYFKENGISQISHWKKLFKEYPYSNIRKDSSLTLVWAYYNTLGSIVLLHDYESIEHSTEKEILNQKILEILY